ncbi:hypothetical protein TWF106_009398 [Orbilia oligospora]|uniref:Uncharacterized protein n=1 Tax=Orbilia oligospora TaxID=2813651 RepID=A0A6G1MAD3_ORBOL|nr:hypothetical protein TWF191_000964 [Orbilia oligospora]KAF3213739.1 hypothetical protein TWF106_009398 [Orbilia oligospora]KAF3218994.1 hypothetical protein TWF679_000405 [Orbilia oligospora]KAF3251427.1 hypothetical protein TWF192_004923 [Orbilia oligospora]
MDPQTDQKSVLAEIFPALQELPCVIDSLLKLCGYVCIHNGSKTNGNASTPTILVLIYLGFVGGFFKPLNNGDDSIRERFLKNNFLASNPGCLVALYAIYHFIVDPNGGAIVANKATPLLVVYAAWAAGYIKLPNISSNDNAESSGNGIPIHHAGIFFAFYLVCEGGFLGFPMVDPNSSNSGTGVINLNIQPPSTGVSESFKRVSINISSYGKVAFLFALACYMPIYNGLPLPFQPWLHCLLLASVVIISAFASTQKFYGPFKFARNKHRLLFGYIYKQVGDWWLCGAILIFHLPPTIHVPLFDISLIVISLAWIKTYHDYCKELRVIAGKATEEVSRAILAESTGREYASTAEQYRKQVIEIAAVRRRDALLANSVRITDYFDCTAKAWAALDEVVRPAKRVVKKAKELVKVSEEAGNSEDSEQGGGKFEDAALILGEVASDALTKAKEIEKQLSDAQQTVRWSTMAVEQDKTARESAKANADRAVSAVQNLDSKMTHLTSTAFAAAEQVVQVKKFADQAIVLATDGDMASARGNVGSAKIAADNVVSSKIVLESIRNDARGILQTLVLID